MPKKEKDLIRIILSSNNKIDPMFKHSILSSTYSIYS